MTTRAMTPTAPRARAAPARSKPVVATRRRSDPQGTNEAVYTEIRNRILSSRLRPGSKLAHRRLAEDLGVSRTPVREALERIYQEGLIIHIRRRGFFVAEINEGEAREHYEMREALELFALGRGFEIGLTADAIATLGTLNRRYQTLIEGDVTRQRMLADRDFHLALAGLAGNQRLVTALGDIFDRVIMKRRIAGYLMTRGVDALHDHLALLAAFRANDRAGAEAVLREHIRAAWQRLRQHLQILTRDDER